jgi:hypothetical protein
MKFAILDAFASHWAGYVGPIDPIGAELLSETILPLMDGN